MIDNETLRKQLKQVVDRWKKENEEIDTDRIRMELESIIQQVKLLSEMSTKAKTIEVVYTLLDDKVQKECDALRKMFDDLVYKSNPWEDIVDIGELTAPKFYDYVVRTPLKTAEELVDEHLLANAPESICECGAFKAMGIARGMAGHSDWCPWSKP